MGLFGCGEAKTVKKALLPELHLRNKNVWGKIWETTCVIFKIHEETVIGYVYLEQKKEEGNSQDNNLLLWYDWRANVW